MATPDSMSNCTSPWPSQQVQESSTASSSDVDANGVSVRPMRRMYSGLPMSHFNRPVFLTPLRSSQGSVYFRWREQGQLPGKMASCPSDSNCGYGRDDVGWHCRIEDLYTGHCAMQP